MTRSKETQIEDLNETLIEILEELGNISNELSELNSSMSMIGTIITIDMLVDKHPEFKDKVAPLMNELLKGLEISLSEVDKTKIE